LERNGLYSEKLILFWKQFFRRFEKIFQTANQVNEFRRPTQIFDVLCHPRHIHVYNFCTKVISGMKFRFPSISSLGISDGGFLAKMVCRLRIGVENHRL